MIVAFLQKVTKDFLGLLDTTAIQQQPLPEATISQKNIPSDLLSNFNDNDLITKDNKTSIPKEDSEPLNLLEEQQQESLPAIENEDANILKNEDKEEAEQEQLLANEGDEIESEEENEQEEQDQEESNEDEQEQEQQQPPLAETLTPNTELVK